MSEPTPKHVALYLVAANGQETPVTGTSFIIGRQFDCHFRPDSGLISRRQTLILREAEGYFVEDLGSAMGTWLNEQIVHGRTLLRDGDELRLADVKLRVRLR